MLIKVQFNFKNKIENKQYWTEGVYDNQSRKITSTTTS